MNLPALPILTWGDPRLLLGPAFLPLWAILVLEVAILLVGQRRIAAELLVDMPWRPLAYAFIAPGTILHETAHALMSTLLLVRVRRFVPFWPQYSEGVGYRFGYVLFDQPGALRSTLISLAPLLLVPVFLLGFNRFLLGSALPIDLGAALAGAGAPRAVPWLVVVALGARSAFPSSRDRLGLIGPVLILGLIVVSLSLALGAMGGPALAGGLQTLLTTLAIPAALNLGVMILLYLI